MIKSAGFYRAFTGTVCAVALTVAAGGAADAKVRMKVQTAFNPTLSVIGEASKNLVDNIERISNGEIQIRYYEAGKLRSEEHTSELQSLMRISYAVFCLKKKKRQHHNHKTTQT